MRLVRALAALTVVVVTSTPLPVHAQANGFEPVASGLNFAVNVAFLPDGRIVVAEKGTGQIRVIEDGRLLDDPLTTLPVDATANETGLLGLALDPSFPDEPWIYAYYSDATDGMNRLVRMRLGGDVADEPETLFDAIATTPIHNGGDLAFGHDGTLFLVTGDGAEEARAQDADDPHGKVLRFERDGSVPEDNPVAGNPMYALGIRNSFGLCVDPGDGSLWETENGPDAWDEVNRIRAGENHGWPDQLGPGGDPTYDDPVIGFEQVIVPTGCAADLERGRLFFGDYGGRLHVVVFPGGSAAPRDEVLATFPPGITDVAWSDDGGLYVLTTSTLYRATGEISAATGSPGSPTGGADNDAGFGSGLRNTAGLVVLAILVAGFVWLRGRALRR
jgi:glucose/arabinose dehydrogenase